MAAIGNNHFMVQDAIDSFLAPVETAYHHIDSRMVAGLLQRCDRAERHRIISGPQSINVLAGLDEIARRSLGSFGGPIEIAHVDQLHRAGPKQARHNADRALEATNALD